MKNYDKITKYKCLTEYLLDINMSGFDGATRTTDIIGEFLSADYIHHKPRYEFLVLKNVAIWHSEDYKHHFKISLCFPRYLVNTDVETYIGYYTMSELRDVGLVLNCRDRFTGEPLYDGEIFNPAILEGIQNNASPDDMIPLTEPIYVYAKDMGMCKNEIYITHILIEA